MIAITAHEVTLAVAALFDPTQPTMPRAFNVLQGTVRGQILVNDLSQPTWAVVRDTIYGTLYFGVNLMHHCWQRLWNTSGNLVISALAAGEMIRLMTCSRHIQIMMA